MKTDDVTHPIAQLGTRRAPVGRSSPRSPGATLGAIQAKFAELGLGEELSFDGEVFWLRLIGEDWPRSVALVLLLLAEGRGLAEGEEVLHGIKES